MNDPLDEQDYLQDILDAIQKVKLFIKGMTFEDFVHDDKTIFAVIRGLEVIGEATKRIPERIKTENPKLPWREMAGMRDKLIHDYAGVNLQVIWKTIQTDLVQLEPQIDQLIQKRDQ